MRYQQAAQTLPSKGHSLRRVRDTESFPPACSYISAAFIRVGRTLFIWETGNEALDPSRHNLAVHAFLTLSEPVGWLLQERKGPLNGSQGLEVILWAGGALLPTVNHLSGVGLGWVMATVPALD